MSYDALTLAILCWEGNEYYHNFKIPMLNTGMIIILCSWLAGALQQIHIFFLNCQKNKIKLYVCILVSSMSCWWHLKWVSMKTLKSCERGTKFSERRRERERNTFCVKLPECFKHFQFQQYTIIHSFILRQTLFCFGIRGDSDVLFITINREISRIIQVVYLVLKTSKKFKFIL